MPPAGLSARGLSTLMDHEQLDARHRNERFLLYSENGSSHLHSPNTANSLPRYRYNSRTNNHTTSYGSICGRTSNNNMCGSSVSDTHNGGAARTVSQQTSPLHGIHSSSQSRQDNSTTIFTAFSIMSLRVKMSYSCREGKLLRFCLRMSKSQATRDGVVLE